MDLSDSITCINGIGEKTAGLYAKLGIKTVHDLINHFPRDYEQWRDVMDIGALRVNFTDTIYATVISEPHTVSIRKNLSVTTIRVRDSSGVCDLVYFNMPYMKNSFYAGKKYLLRGRAALRQNRIVLEQPRILKPEEFEKNLNRMTPVYPTTKGLSSAAIAKAVSSVLGSMRLGEDYIPDKLRLKYGIEPVAYAYYCIHFPNNRDEMLRARKRLVFEEFLFFIISVMVLKEYNKKETDSKPMLRIDGCGEFISKLPYQLTGAQLKVWHEIEDDLSSTRLMNRLVQGDVGSGKTIVAVLAMYMCVMNHAQAAFMAPTEVLAAQHYEYIQSLVNDYGLPFKPVLLTGSLTAREKRRIKEGIVLGTANVIIGTQALLQEDVDFYNLRLVITDEQHRFGVNQRETLAKKGIEPHILVMSATPIPRTLALIIYGDLDISVMDELPADRLPIKNCVVGANYRKKTYEFIANQVKQGRQAYVICPMAEAADEISESIADLENVVDYTQKLKNALPEGVRVEYLHGQMKPKAKTEIMDEFEKHNIDVLVSTTVVEVGINVPNATVMVVENAQRFGLAQLHQLRGRVGRGNHQSYCVFISTSDQKEALERLQVLNKSNDGFFIASEDMRLRGPGDLFGIRQSGQFSFQIGDIYQDADILQSARQCAEELYESYISNDKAPVTEHEKFWKHYKDNINNSDSILYSL